MTTNHLQFSEILNWLEGRLSEEEAAQVAQKLKTADEATRTDLEWLRGFLEISETARATSPPPEVRAELREQFQTFIQSKRTPSIFQRLIASLTFDSSTRFAAAGVRSATTEGKTRQLIYDMNLAEIALNIQPRLQDQQITLIGQIFPKRDFSPEGVTIQLVDAQFAEKGLTTSDELGEFTVEPLFQGQYDIVLMTDQFEIVLQDVPLQQ